MGKEKQQRNFIKKVQHFFKFSAEPLSKDCRNI